MNNETANLVATSKVNDLLEDLNSGYEGLTTSEAAKRQKVRRLTVRISPSRKTMSLYRSFRFKTVDE